MYLYYKVKPKIKRPAILDDIDEAYCRGILTDTQKLGLKFRELEFGESFMYDYYKYRGQLKRKIYEHGKQIGVHLSRSKRQVKVNDNDVKMMKRMEINNAEVCYDFNIKKGPIRTREWVAQE